jgi:hypothetical protein
MDPLLRLRRLSELKPTQQKRRFDQARRATTSERLAEALELSDVARALARSVGATWLTSHSDDLRDKASRYLVGR